MATLNVSTTCVASGNLGLSASATVSAGSQSVGENYTNVNYSYSATRTGWQFTGTTRSNAGSLILVINGSTVVNVALPLSSGSTNGSGVTSGSGSVRVYHNDDGTKTASLSLRIAAGSDPRGANYYWNNSTTATGSLGLTAIPRSSTPSMSAGSAELGSSIMINTNRASSSFTHSLWWSCGSSGWQSIATGVGASYSWSIPYSIANYIASSASGTVSILCRTFNNGNQIGSDKTTSFTATIPGSFVPSISGFSVSEAVSDVKNKFGAYLKGASKLNISFNASGTYSSWITGYSISANGQSWSSNSATSDILASSGNMTIKVTATDSRGRTSSQSADINVLDYSTPSISYFKGIRCNSDGTTNDGGTYLKLQINAGVSNISGNTASWQVGYSTGSDATTWKDLGSLGISFNSTTGVVSGVTFDNNTSYSLRLKVTDKLGNSAESLDTLATEFVLMDFYKSGKGIAFGKVAENDNFEVGMDASFYKPLRAKSSLYAYENFSVRGNLEPWESWSGDGNTEAYALLGTIKINDIYVNGPIEICYTQRGNSTPVSLYIRFAPINNTDPDISIFRYDGDCFGAYICKMATSTWNVYINKSEAWDGIGILYWSTGYLYGRVSFARSLSNISSLPSGGFWAVSSVKTLLIDKFFPVGSIYLTYNNNNPGNFIGGTWVQFGQGRTLVGEGTGNDGSTSMPFGANSTGGAYKNTHNHYQTNSFDGASGYMSVSAEVPRSRTKQANRMNFNGGVARSVTREDSTYNETINIVQPYIVIYFWRRTA